MTFKSVAKEIKRLAYKEGDFILSSGKKSNYIIDKYLFECEPILLKSIMRLVVVQFGDIIEQSDKIACVELGGVVLGSALSLEIGKPMIIVKKAKKGYGTDKRIEGAYNNGERVVLIEDIITTGGQAIKAIGVLEEAGLICSDIIAIVDRLEGGRENISKMGVKLHSLFTIDDIREA